MLKPYMVYEDGYSAECAELVFANNAKEAKKLAAKCFDSDYIDLRVNFIKNAPPYIKELIEPQVIGITSHNSGYFRNLGWHIEGDASCGSCSLSTMDGEFPLCETCDFCQECGHDSNCPEQPRDEQTEQVNKFNNSKPSPDPCKALNEQEGT